MNADQFNALYPVGTPVIAYPGARPERDPDATRIVTTTRSRATVLGGHTDVVWVEGHGACIALTHIDVVRADAPRRPRLSRQRLAILVALTIGESTEETARRLCLSPHTVKTHRRQLYKQLGATGGAAHAVGLAYQLGILRPPGGAS